MKIFYQIVDKSTVENFIRFESEKGDIDESVQELHKGESFFGVPFERFIDNQTDFMEIEKRLCLDPGRGCAITN